VGELRVLIIEDSEDDVQLLLRELRKGGFEPAWERVETSGALETALREHPWDIVLSDYALPSFNGMEALGLVRRYSPDLPFILVSGKVGEDIAAEVIRRGAQDFVLKDGVSRLVSAIERERVEFKMRRERKEAIAALYQSEARYRTVVSSLAEGVVVTDPGGRVETFNNSALRILGVPAEEMRGRTLFDAGWEAAYEDGTPIAAGRPSTLDALHAGMDQKAVTLRILTPDGARRWIMFNVQSLRRGEEDEPSGFLVSFSDITLRKYAEDHLRYLSTRDALTGVYNRAYFEEEVSRLDRGRRFPVTVVMADVDDLKAVNDTYGHPAGDAVLRRTAAALLSSFRAEDTVARIGGDEFVVLVPLVDAQVAERVLERVRVKLAETDPAPLSDRWSVSLGAATAERSGDLGAALDSADKRMYEDKRRRCLANGQPSRPADEG
jgi:diguanylate cyclase (GGDEF)-like protein/PAS domain S-box-containing protein